ncbi:hypothetical protein CDL12_30355 [Handroanthus impetiginosus]|uniref:DYW domain-containing protein n=1 Tax=Handroanthus impetiginosus TaxID=429701 RepID=A0A2G9FVS6_9LAMI|nr:hypothetical protein CDL12_30355 [Handroanthus impetiginosus]
MRDSVSWNVMIRGYVKNGMVEHARELFDEMPEKTSFSWNTMIMGYIRAGKIHRALKLFVVMPDKDVVSWTVMVTGLCHASRVDEAWCLFKQMPQANAVSWSSMVSGFQQHGLPNESLNAFREMLLAGFQPTSHSLTSVLSACADLAMVSVSEHVYCQLLKRGFHDNTHVGNSAITMFIKTGSFHSARRIFLDLENPDRVSWNTMIMGFAQHGYGVEAIMIFRQMQKAQIKPDGISYMGVLLGRQYFQSMKMDHGISPKLEHFAAVVDLYARAGKLKEAYKVVTDMPFEPTTIFWRTLLHGCRIWGDIEMGVHAAEEILKLEPRNTSACLMVVNIFALSGKWNEVAKIRQHMRNTEVKKELGCSWINIKGRNHFFTTRDEVHPEGDRIFEVVELLAYDIKRYYLRFEEFSYVWKSCIM